MTCAVDHIPSELKRCPQWVVWQVEPRNGRPTKVPYYPYGGMPPIRARSDDPKMWGRFEEAQQALKSNQYNGLGFVFSRRDSFCGIDLDNVIDPETGEVDEKAADIVRLLDSYTEVSPSGTGLHIIVKASLAELKGRRKGNVEMYDQRRFFTMTGQVYGERRPVATRQDELDAVHGRIFGAPRKRTSTPSPSVAKDLRQDDVALLESIRASKQGSTFSALWDGDVSGYRSHSEADQALANHLMWWTDYDVARADRLFRQSALYRSKWDKRHFSDGTTYGQATLAKATEGRGPGDGYRGNPQTLADSDDEASDKMVKSQRGRPTIQVNRRYLRDITADALDALKAANNPPSFFMRGTVPVRVGEEAQAEALTNTSLKGTLDRVADFVKVTTKQSEDGKPTTEETPARPPSDLAPDILTRPSLPFPRLEAIATAPVVLPDGSLLLEDAFNEEHGILLRLDGLKNLRADMPADEALALLEDVFGDFPFAEPDAGRAHTLSMLLQPFIRPLVRGPTPLYLIDAPARGTGKGLLSEVMALITSGRPAPVMSQPRDGDELEKRITTVLLEGRPIVFWDNVTQLKSPHLAATLTAEVWQGRILGKSELVSVPNRAVWLATGNNVEISDEFARRIIPIRLDAGVERPEDRKHFRHPNLPEYVRAHRSELVSAGLSLIQLWIDAGMPTGKKTLGRFESWAGVIGGILEVAGVSGFLSGRERLYNDADSETKEWAALCAAWWKSYEARPITAGDLFEVAKAHDLLLDLWGGRSALGAKQRFGHALGTRRDRVFGDYKVVSAGRDSATRNAAYRLEWVGIKTPETPETPEPEQEDAPITQESAEAEARCFVGTAPETPDKHPQNTRRESTARDGAFRPAEGVTGVLGVLVGPPDNQDDGLSHLVGTMEGEL
jgi:hypothetical protein